MRKILNWIKKHIKFNVSGELFAQVQNDKNDAKSKQYGVRHDRINRTYR